MSGLWNRSMFGFLQSRPTNTLTDYINIGPVREKAEAMLCDFQNTQQCASTGELSWSIKMGMASPGERIEARNPLGFSDWRQKFLALLFFGMFSLQRLLAVLPLIPLTFLLQITCSASASCWLHDSASPHNNFLVLVPHCLVFLSCLFFIINRWASI